MHTQKKQRKKKIHVKGISFQNLQHYQIFWTENVSIILRKEKLLNNQSSVFMWLLLAVLNKLMVVASRFFITSWWNSLKSPWIKGCFPKKKEKEKIFFFLPVLYSFYSLNLLPPQRKFYKGNCRKGLQNTFVEKGQSVLSKGLHPMYIL